MAHVDQSPVFFLLSRKRSILAVAEDSSLVWLQNIAKKVPLNLSHQARGCRRLQKILVQNIFYAHQVEPMWFHQYGELILKVEGSASICGQKLFLSGVRAVSCITEGCSSSLMASSFFTTQRWIAYNNSSSSDHLPLQYERAKSVHPPFLSCCDQQESAAPKKPAANVVSLTATRNVLFLANRYQKRDCLWMSSSFRTELAVVVFLQICMIHLIATTSVNSILWILCSSAA